MSALERPQCAHLAVLAGFCCLCAGLACGPMRVDRVKLVSCGYELWYMPSSVPTHVLVPKSWPHRVPPMSFLNHEPADNPLCWLWGHPSACLFIFYLSPSPMCESLHPEVKTSSPACSRLSSSPAQPEAGMGHGKDTRTARDRGKGPSTGQQVQRRVCVVKMLSGCQV